MSFNGEGGARVLTLTGNSTVSNRMSVGIGDGGGETTVIKSGTGTWQLLGANSYSGATIITGGILRIATMANGGSGGVLGQSNSDAQNLIINGGTLRYSGAGDESDRLFSIGTSGGTLL